MKLRDAPRASGETLLAVALVIAVLAVAHGWLDTVAGAGVALGAACWRIADTLRGRMVVPGWRIVVFAAVGLGAIAWQGGGDGYSALAVRSLVVLAGLKLLETRSLRDLYTVVYLGFFLVGTLFLYRQSIAIAVFGLVIVAVLTGVLVRASSTGSRSGWRRQVVVGGRLLALGLPFAGLLFFVFPRLPGPLWHFGVAPGVGTTGLGDTMEPGLISQLVLSQDIAFRAAFAGRPPQRSQLYWRGPVLWETNGRRWHRRETAPLRGAGTASGTRTEYVLILEPHGQQWIPALDLPSTPRYGFSLSEDYELAANQPIRERTTYRLSSLTDPLVPGLTSKQRVAGLQLPEEVSERMRELVRQLADGAKAEADIVAAVLQYFRVEPFHYSLRPPPLGDDPVDEFLFDSRTGFCEHYAAAFVVLMRLAGIPARVVTGYQGGELNPHNGQLLVRQSDAHAWAEVWLRGQGWKRVDPTAAVAPGRINLGLDVATAVARGGVPVFGADSALWRKLAREAGWLVDAMEMAWYRNVVNYSDRRQQNLLHDLGITAFGSLATEITLAASIIGVIGLTGLLALFRTAPARAIEVQLYERFCRKLERSGIAREPAEGPFDFSARVQRRLTTDQAALADAITRHYVALRYGSGGSDDDLAVLRELVTRFRPRSLADADRQNAA
jgi:transglutaminase-like putative cysteine protease